MDERLQTLDWAAVQVFLAVAETGSLSAAARRLGQSQPTLGRKVRALEGRLGMTLFLRQPRGLILSEEGRQILGPARRMAEAVGEVALIAAARDDRLAGTCRVTASRMVATRVLPPILARIRAELPQLQVELVASDDTDSLMYREADIALRMYRPVQPDLIARHLGDVTLGAFASRDYLDRMGRPAQVDDLVHHALVGYDRADLILKEMARLGLPPERARFATRCDDQVTYWELVRAGCGIGFGQIPLIRGDAAVEQVLPDLDLPTLPLWIAAHESLRPTPRVSAVWDRLAAGLRSYLA
ncbi:HTH-type transcriptional regulator DmlR [Pseudooceanicola marinus]|uniref:HTH-type transcriptional regulator DmlR n=1 Tax=Pseudooceanicola marinus TaxID=396013 RepID=A0A1X6ZHW3_9RHOB|nr:LysR family transcriptional regulator [Pseudooceanicola marinus]SLN52178.1 HTH-type transcriptional regulator DmlR [Pseudooceanicola marinus]